MSMKAITIVTAQGVREYIKGIDFDIATEAKEHDNTVSYFLYKDGKIVVWIHPLVPVVIAYD